MGFNLDLYERHVHRRDYEPAARQLMELLAALDANYGAAGADFEARLHGVPLPEELDEQLTTRIAAATAFLFSDRQLNLSPSGLVQFLNWQRWLGALFAASPFRNADSVLRALNDAETEGSDRLVVPSEDLHKFCLLYGPESNVPLDFDALWDWDREMAAGLALALLSPRFLGTDVAHAKREILLPWLAEHLPQIEDMDALPAGILHDVYMHCSYADRADKHDVKRAINTLVRRKLKERGLYPLPTPAPVAPGDKPVLLVVLEWFNAAHSIYRTHSRTMEAARERFTTVGIGLAAVDRAGRDVFDSFLELPEGGLWEHIVFIREAAHRLGAQVLYMPSVGMHPLTMFLANLRLAPLQVMGLGHPATSHSPDIDHVVVEEDYVGDPACFSETLLLLPPDGMPYRPPAGAARLDPAPVRRRKVPQTVEIAVAATTMKLNPGFLAACARIAERVARPIRFQFLVGQAIGWVYPQVERLCRQYLGDRATVHPHQPYEQYMARIAACDLFINPFPFGNTNGIIDTVGAGLVGVCRTGREVHEHIDEGLFRRLGFPDWLIASSTDAYVDAAVRLIGDDQERWTLSQGLAGPRALDRLFVGRPELFGERLLERLAARAPADAPVSRSG